jgi:Alg9-like mannosyltransferase family
VNGRKIAFVLAALAVLAVSTWEAASIYRIYLANPRVPLWDMAGHGWGGVELLRTLRRPLHFLDLLNRQDKWPFGYSLLLMPFLAAGDWSFASATLLSTVLFAFVPVLMLWAAREVDDGPVGLWGGLIAAALFLSSPLLRVFGVLIMREMAGVFFTLLALGFYLRARRLGTPGAWRLAGLVTLALFLTKYNYALVWVAAMLVNEVWRMTPEQRRELVRRASRWKILMGYLALLFVVALFGVNPGVGVYAGLVIGVVFLIVRWRRDPEVFRARWRSLPVEVRAALATFVIPVWIWWLSPRPIHPKEAIAFLRNRSAGPPLLSWQSLSYYFRSLINDYSAVPVLGVLVVLGVLLSLLWLKQFRPLALTAFLGLGLATFHPYKEPRFLAVTVPFLMLLAAITFSRAVHWRRSLIGGFLCAGAVAGIAWAASGADLNARLERNYKVYSARPGYWRALAFLANHAAGADRVAVIGSFNEMSESLVRWWLALGEKTENLDVVDGPSRRKALRTWLEEERPERILAIRLLPSSRLYQGKDFQSFNAWQLAAIDSLEKDEGWKVTRRRRFEGLEMEILVLRPLTSPPSPAQSPAPPPPSPPGS